MLEAAAAAAGAAAAVAFPVLGLLLKLENRLTRLETTITERLPAPRFHEPRP